ncbi:creatininase family protein [Jiangella sp. DSM 45060]|uniref:creatininase family protein n=1 Tax=Jiangella sp. DSM 45060 TaxID=1798224 RepID=UPI00087C9E77|nr:creatininase family protein [Jiangella sp. DSM 45060]SDS42981.1 creatinine amidohydrolase [Jiangella sp. DSM 45060]
MTVRQLDELTWAELRAVAPASIALLPIGSQEQHGARLPLGTDTLLVRTIVARALAEELPDVVLAPALPYGLSPHHRFAAAVTLTASTLQAVLGEVLDSLVDCGFRRMLIVNGHGGNDEPMRLAVKSAALRHDVAVAAANYWSLGDPGRSPGHAGRFETSLLLAAEPALVRPAGASSPAPSPPPLFEHPPYPGLVAERHGEWARAGGVTDDASGAAADHDLLAGLGARLAAAIRAFDEATAASHHRERN